MTSRFVSRQMFRRVAVLLIGIAVGVSIRATLRSHWDLLWNAVTSMAAVPIAFAFGLCLIHRVVNAHGWTMVVGALGHRLPAVQGARIWMASEACRWLPGSVWSYGSRAVLATRAGVPPVLAAVSLLWELILTLLAWTFVAGAGVLLWEGPVPEPVVAGIQSIFAHPWLSGFGVLATIAAMAALGSKAVHRRLARFAATGREFGGLETDRRALIGVLGFYVMMAVLNGLTFWQVVRATPGGDRCPIAVVMAANSVAWLVGLFALFAPGGLVVREATIGVLLSGWLPVEQAVSVALAWRAIQVTVEICGCLLMVTGFSRSEVVRSASAEGVDV